MTTYVTVEFTPIDKDKLQNYATKAAPTIAEYGGEFLARGPVQSLSADTDFDVKAIIAFPSKEQAESWYNSPSYQALVDIRNQAMRSRFLLIAS